MHVKEFLNALRAEETRLQAQVTASRSEVRREKISKQLTETKEVLEWIDLWEEDCWDKNDEAAWKNSVILHVDFTDETGIDWRSVVYWLMTRQGWTSVDGKLTPPKD